MKTSGATRREIAKLYPDVIACDKREAFAQGSEATKQSMLPHSLLHGLLSCARNDGGYCLAISAAPTPSPSNFWSSCISTVTRSNRPVNSNGAA